MSRSKIQKIIVRDLSALDIGGEISYMTSAGDVVVRRVSVDAALIVDINKVFKFEAVAVHISRLM